MDTHRVNVGVGNTELLALVCGIPTICLGGVVQDKRMQFDPTHPPGGYTHYFDFFQGTIEIF